MREGRLSGRKVSCNVNSTAKVSRKGSKGALPVPRYGNFNGFQEFEYWLCSRRFLSVRIVVSVLMRLVVEPNVPSQECQCCQRDTDSPVDPEMVVNDVVAFRACLPVK